MTSEKQVTIPEGYKQTEVGVVPEDWGVSTVNNISLIPMQNGLFYEPQRKGRGIPLINVGDMYASAPIDVYSLDLFDATHSEIKVFKVQKGDLFFTRSSIVPSGIAYCNTFKEENTVAVFDSHLIRVRPNQEVMNADFLYLNCIANYSRKFLISSAKTATMTTIDQGAIKKCPVLVPPLKEQTAIANALSDVDKLIAALETLIAKKSAIKTAAMQQLLTGKKRLPGFLVESAKESEKQAATQIQAQATKQNSDQPANSAAMANASQIKTAQHQHAAIQGQPNQSHSNKSSAQTAPRPGYKQTELGEIPEDWEVLSYDESFKFLTTASNSRSDLTEVDELSYIHYGDIHTLWNIKLDFSKVCLPKISKAKVGGAVPLKDGDVIMADASEDYAGIGKSIEIQGLGNTKAVSGLHTFLLRDKGYFVDGFRGYLHLVKAVKSNFDRLATGLKVYGLSKNSLKEVLLPVPPKPEQTAIAKVLSDMDAELEALQQRLSKTKTIKQGMMQELLTGKTRLV